MTYAEKIEARRRNLAKLPEVAYAYHPTQEYLCVAIKRGDNGCYPMQTMLTPKELNARAGVTEDQAQAMLDGSMFGWHVPAADVDAVKAERLRREAAKAVR